MPDEQVKAESESPVTPEPVATTLKASSNETASAVAPTQPPPVRTLDGVFLGSAFQQVRSVDAEIQAGIEAVLKLQLEAAAAPPAAEPSVPEVESAAQEVKQLEQEAQKVHKIAMEDVSVTEEVPVSTAPIKEEVTPSEKVVETPEPSLAEVAEAVFSETKTPTTPQTPAQEPSAPAAPLQTGTLEVTKKEVLLDSSGPQVTASKATTPNASALNNEPGFATSQEQEVKADEAWVPGATESEFVKSQKQEARAVESSAPDGTVSEAAAQSESLVRGFARDQFTKAVLDDIAAEAAAAAAADASNAGQSQDAFVEAVLKERMKTPGQSKESEKEAKKDTLLSAVDNELEQRKDGIRQSAEQVEAASAGIQEPSRMPRNVQALYLQPLRRVAKHGVPSCDLQLRSYSVRPLESFCDFALRAAYYCGLPAYGPVPLPKIIERWTVPKSSFIFKKSQENFERITRRRLIQIRDGHPQTVQMWLAFLQKHQQAAVGMKANMWEFSSMGKSRLFLPVFYQGRILLRLILTLFADVAKEMDKAYEEAQESLTRSYNFLGQTVPIETAEKVDEILHSERYRMASGR